MCANNFHQLKNYVNTEYSDLLGVIKMDTQLDVISIYQLCKDCNFDTTQKFIVGFGVDLNFTENMNLSDEVSCFVLFLDKRRYGNTYENIETAIEGETLVTMYKKVIRVPYDALGKYFDSLQFITTTKLMQSATNISIELV